MVFNMNIYRCKEDSELNIREPQVIFPGTFNPYHKGHQAIANHADVYTGKHTLLEHSIDRVGKNNTIENDIFSSLSDYFEIHNRTLIVTNAKFFWQKAQLFPGSTFVVGVDTFKRIIDHKLIMDEGVPEDSAKRVVEYNLKRVRDCNCDFLVYPRYVKGVLKTMPHYDDGLHDLSNFTDMSHRLIEPKFMPVDISSTELRNLV